MICTCWAPEPGWPQHLPECGKPEPQDDCTCDGDTINPNCVEHGHLTEQAGTE